MQQPRKPPRPPRSPASKAHAPHGRPTQPACRPTHLTPSTASRAPRPSPRPPPPRKWKWAVRGGPPPPPPPPPQPRDPVPRQLTPGPRPSLRLTATRVRRLARGPWMRHKGRGKGRGAIARQVKHGVVRPGRDRNNAPLGSSQGGHLPPWVRRTRPLHITPGARARATPMQVQAGPLAAARRGNRNIHGRVGAPAHHPRRHPTVRYPPSPLRPPSQADSWNFVSGG
jgi:hypothetical protein